MGRKAGELKISLPGSALGMGKGKVWLSKESIKTIFCPTPGRVNVCL